MCRGDRPKTMKGGREAGTDGPGGLVTSRGG
jgi:hypothetical protein